MAQNISTILTNNAKQILATEDLPIATMYDAVDFGSMSTKAAPYWAIIVWACCQISEVLWHLCKEISQSWNTVNYQPPSFNESLLDRTISTGFDGKYVAAQRDLARCLERGQIDECLEAELENLIKCLARDRGVWTAFETLEMLVKEE